LQHHAARLQHEDQAAFFLPLNQTNSLESVRAALDEHTPRFEKWRNSSETGYFFLDAVDEARLINGTPALQTALRAIRNVLRPHLQRSSFFVSSRITDWSVPGVQQTVEGLLLKPLCDAEPSRDAAKSANTDTLEVKGNKNVSSIPLEVYCLDPLSEADAKRYAEAHGAKPVEAFWQAVEEGGYEFMASRPLDLEWMVKQRIASKKLGTYVELIETAVTYRLRETNQSYIDSGAVLSPERLREGAELSSWPSFHLSSPRPVSAKRYACSMQPTPVWGHKRGGRRGGVFHPFMNIPFEIVPSQLFRAGRSRASPQNILEGAAYNPS
jgi:hypothetical protein